MRQQHVAPLPAVVPAARKATAAVSGGGRGSGPSGRSGTQAAARGCVRAGSRAPRGSGPGIGAGGHRPPAPHSDPREARSEGWSWNSRPACVTVPQELRLTFAPGNFCDEKIRLCYFPSWIGRYWVGTNISNSNEMGSCCCLLVKGCMLKKTETVETSIAARISHSPVMRLAFLLTTPPPPPPDLPPYLEFLLFELVSRTY
ncbi:uncharacterized protein LOC114689056 [Peromyscus leucopus]|uniref:uncharacterized protein LOC114689056 n=1 Tax=Peromyscus leucopus TaxID=10041 RepID=UPI0010A1BF33|nr:uncharacterized protein LOC114689056 [Peromyscus leucopus]